MGGVEHDGRAEEEEDEGEDEEDDEDDDEDDEDKAIAAAKRPGRKPLGRSAANRSSTHTPKASATARTLW